MKISDPSSNEIIMERHVYRQMLPLKCSKVLELGCGRAELTRAIAETDNVDSILALEVDLIQHKKNLLIDDLPNVEFTTGAAEAIPAKDNSFDVVLMFKSLHHVPLDKMDKALSEVHRVLKPGGLAYISEPVFEGEFNEIMRLFHDEKEVRLAAFEAIKRSVNSGFFNLEEERFFYTPKEYKDFEAFEERILKATHVKHELSQELYGKVKELFMTHMTDDGAQLPISIRVDLLRKRRVIL